VVVLIALGSSVAVRVAQWLPAHARAVVVILMGVALAVAGVRTAAARHAFTLHLTEARFTDVGSWIRANLPARAVVLSVWHSGSIRFYGQRFTVLWDAIDPAEFDDVIRTLDAAGRPPFLVVESWEAPRFRERFSSASRLGALDWPPRVQIGREVALYGLPDRARFFSGQRIGTERIWTTEERAARRRR
jgi:hypothetical protein